MKALVVGYNAWDVLVPLAGPPPRDGKQEVADIVATGGGPAANAAVALARLGASVRLVTPLADDLPGREQRRELEAAGVDCRSCPPRRGGTTPRSVILVHAATGERSILWRRGRLEPLAPGEAREAWLDDCDLLLCDSHEPAAALVLARAARQRGLPVVLDGGTARDGLAELVPLCSDVIASAIFAPALTGEPAPARALPALAARGPARVAQTCGAAGCLALADGALVHVPAFAVPVLDTTGAGDAFHGGYAFARLQGRPWLDALTFAAAVAGLSCRALGGRAGLPDLAEAEALCRHGARRPDAPAF